MKVEFPNMDRIIVEFDTLLKIQEWCSNHRDVIESNIGGLPLQEGVLSIGFPDFPTEIVFKAKEDRIDFAVYMDGFGDVTKFYFDNNTSEFKAEEGYYSKGIERIANTNNQMQTGMKFLSSAWVTVMMYMRDFSQNEEQVTVTERKVAHSKKPRKGIGKNRITYLTRKTYKLYIPDGLPKREYSRQAESWQVRGHFRTTKTGKKIWVKPHIKGQGHIEPKTYKITGSVE